MTLRASWIATMRASRVATVVALLAWIGAAAPASAAASPPPIRHVFVIVLENKSFDETFGYNSAAPYLSVTLPGRGALLPNYFGITHESLGNYIGLISGQGSSPITQTDCQVYVDVTPGTIGANGQALGPGCVYPSQVQTLAGQLAGARLTWKGYMEDMGNAAGQATSCRHPVLGAPDPTQQARAGDQYAARHNPFIYFRSIIDTAACAQDDVPLTALPADLASAATTPNLAFITPNLCDDGHDAPCVDGRPGGLASINAFLSAWVPRILASPAYRADGLLAILFDESDGVDTSACCNEQPFPNTTSNGLFGGLGGGRMGAVLLSRFIDPGTVDTVAYNHFTMLRSLEDIFHLGHLGYAAAPGLASLGTDAFTCYARAPRVRHGRLPHGSEIKLAVIGQGTAPRPMVEIELWHPGTVKVQVPRRTGSLRRLGRVRHPGACELLKIALPARHGTVLVTARAFGGTERRTLHY